MRTHITITNLGRSTVAIDLNGCPSSDWQWGIIRVLPNCTVSLVCDDRAQVDFVVDALRDVSIIASLKWEVRQGDPKKHLREHLPVVQLPLFEGADVRWQSKR